MSKELNQNVSNAKFKEDRVILNKVIRKYNKWLYNCGDIVESSNLLSYIEEHLKMRYANEEANIKLRLELEEMRHRVSAVLDSNNVHIVKSTFDGRFLNNLPLSCIGDNESGWKVSGEIHHDWYDWLEDFEAEHPKYGRVWGNFRNNVYATSFKAYKKFMKKHPLQQEDYWDI